MYPKVTIVGAGNVGATAAHILLERDIAHVALVDVVEGLAAGKALDMMHMRSIEKFGPKVCGSHEYDISKDSDVVVITAGIARKPGMTREDLLDTNSKILKDCIDNAVKASPNAIFLIVTNPLDQMAYLGYKRALEHGIDASRVIGMGGVLDSARFAYEIVNKLDCNINDVEALVIGAHGQGMLPLSRFASVNNNPLVNLLPEEEIHAIEERTIHGGAEVVSLLKTGSAYYAPGAAIAKMVETIVTDAQKVLSASVYLNGEYNLNDLYMCVPARLGKNGVISIEELELNSTETERLNQAAEQIIEGITSLGLRD